MVDDSPRTPAAPHEVEGYPFFYSYEMPASVFGAVEEVLEAVHQRRPTNGAGAVAFDMLMASVLTTHGHASSESEALNRHSQFRRLLPVCDPLDLREADDARVEEAVLPSFRLRFTGREMRALLMCLTDITHG